MVEGQLTQADSVCGLNFRDLPTLIGLKTYPTLNEVSDNDGERV